ncbi:MAG: hypothetical protein C0483_19260 [Pirellula sp.]|nr:hypothetical protein [Pirellula sp.]
MLIEGLNERVATKPLLKVLTCERVACEKSGVVELYAVAEETLNRDRNVDRVGIEQGKDLGFLFTKTADVVFVLFRRVNANDAAGAILAIEESIGLRHRVERNHGVDVA